MAIPKEWQNADQLDGFDLIDKSNLVGVPFRISSVRFDQNAAGVSYVYCDAENAIGDTFTFNDSSSGVRAQIVAFLSSRDMDSAVDTGVLVPMNLVAPRGLRVSEYEVRDDRGKTKNARTYYLTTSGQRASEPVVSPAKTRRQRAASAVAKGAVDAS